MLTRVSARILGVFGALLLTGCVASTKVAPPEITQKIRQIHVVPIESHALNIEDQTAFAGSTVAGLGLISRSNFSNQRGLLVAGTLMMLAEASSADRKDQQATASAKIDETLRKSALWSPNAEVAKEVARQLTASGVTATISEQPRMLPPLPSSQGGQVRPTPTTRALNWYADESATSHYSGAGKASSDNILEVGIGVYTIGGGMFIAQVHLKLIDPLTGAVVGRSRGYDYHGVGRDDLWVNDGARFKELFGRIVSKGVAEALRDLGLQRNQPRLR